VQLHSAARKPALIHREILCVAYDDRSLDDVLQFAMLPGQGYDCTIPGSFVYPANALFPFFCITIDEVLNQHRISSRRSAKEAPRWKNVEPVKRGTPEYAGSDSLLQVAMVQQSLEHLFGSIQFHKRVRIMFLQNTQECDLVSAGKLGRLRRGRSCLLQPAQSV